MIEALHLRKVFGRVEAVRDVSFQASSGQITGLLGPNGAGKTTTMRMLGTLISPTSGTALVDGLDLSSNPAGGRKLLGVLPDLRGLCPRLTPREEIRYFGQLNGLSDEVLESRIDLLIDRLGLKAVADRSSVGFSQGERTKVAIARALIHDPGNVLLDEPTNGLDVMTTRAMRDIVRSLREEGRCVVYTSHVMQEVAAVCDKIVIVCGGRVVASGTADEIRDLAQTDGLEDAFVKIVERSREQGEQIGAERGDSSLMKQANSPDEESADEPSQKESRS